jgi:hypothetical protein
MRRLAVISVACVMVAMLQAPAAASPGNIVVASTSDSNVKSNRGAVFPSLSADGSRVAFVSPATNLDPADTDSSDDVYV